MLAKILLRNKFVRIQVDSRKLFPDYTQIKCRGIWVYKFTLFFFLRREEGNLETGIHVGPKMWLKGMSLGVGAIIGRSL